MLHVSPECQVLQGDTEASLLFSCCLKEAATVSSSVTRTVKSRKKSKATLGPDRQSIA